MLYEMTLLHFKDLKRSIYGEVNYRLHGRYREMFIPRSVWKTYDEVKRSKIFRNFLEIKIKVKDGKSGFIKSSYTDFTVLSLHTAKKSGQRTRIRKTPSHYVQRCIYMNIQGVKFKDVLYEYTG